MLRNLDKIKESKDNNTLWSLLQETSNITLPSLLWSNIVERGGPHGPRIFALVCCILDSDLNKLATGSPSLEYGEFRQLCNLSRPGLTEALAKLDWAIGIYAGISEENFCRTRDRVFLPKSNRKFKASDGLLRILNPDYQRLIQLEVESFSFSSSEKDTSNGVFCMGISGIITSSEDLYVKSVRSLARADGCSCLPMWRTVSLSENTLGVVRDPKSNEVVKLGRLDFGDPVLIPKNKPVRFRSLQDFRPPLDSMTPIMCHSKMTLSLELEFRLTGYDNPLVLFFQYNPDDEASARLLSKKPEPPYFSDWHLVQIARKHLSPEEIWYVRDWAGDFKQRHLYLSWRLKQNHLAKNWVAGLSSVDDEMIQKTNKLLALLEKAMAKEKIVPRD